MLYNKTFTFQHPSILRLDEDRADFYFAGFMKERWLTQKYARESFLLSYTWIFVYFRFIACAFYGVIITGLERLCGMIKKNEFGSSLVFNLYTL